MLGLADHESLFRSYSMSDPCSGTPNVAAIGAALESCKIRCLAELSQRQA